MSNECGSVNTTISITIPVCIDCQDCVPATTVDSPGTTTSLNTAIVNGDLPPGGAFNTDYCIAGTLEIDANGFYDFNNCSLRMLPGASIIVRSGAQLAIENNSVLYSCEELWQGIIVEEVDNGITASLPNTGEVQIGGPGDEQKNTINAAFNGIMAAGFAANGTVIIENNNLTIGASGARGIRLAGSFSDDATIKDNLITLQGSGRGLELLSLENTRVEGNIIELENAPQALAGMSLQAAESVLLVDNTINGSGLGGDADHNIGLEVFSSADVGYCCNSFDNTRLGVRVRGSSMSTDQFRGTVFGDHATGLQLDEGSILGTQTHSENRWTGGYSSGNGAVYDVDVLTASSVPFFIDLNGSNGDPSFGTLSSPSGWFQLDENLNTQNYCQQADCAIDGFLTPNPDDDYIIQGGSNLTPFSSAVAWQLQKQALKHFQNAGNYPTNFQSIITSLENSSVGSHLAYSSLLKVVFLLSSVDRTSCITYLFQKQSEVRSLLDVEKAFVNSRAIGIGEQGLISRLNALTTAQQTSKDAKILNGNLLSTQQSEAATHLSVDLLSAEAYTAYSEDTYQLQLSLGLTPWLTPSTTELQTLDNIAAQCPLGDGNGVFLAQSLLTFLDDPFANFDQVDCSKSKALRSTNHTEVEVPHTPPKETFGQLLVYPNPTGVRELTIKFPVTYESTQLALLSTKGEILRHWSVPAEQGSRQIQLQDLPAGLYLLTWTNKERSLTEKIILR